MNLKAVNKTLSVCRFNEYLDQMRNRHLTVVETMAEGILEMKKEYGEAAEDGHTANCVQYFLDRLYASRIGMSVLVKHHCESSVNGRWLILYQFALLLIEYKQPEICLVLVLEI